MVIVNLLGHRVVVKRIDGKVASCRILPHRAENIIAYNAPFGILSNSDGIEGPKRRALDNLRPEQNVNNLETASDDNRTTLRALDLFGRCIRHHIKVFGGHAEQKIANGASDDKRFKPALLQGLTRFLGLPTHKFRIDAVLGLFNDARRLIKRNARLTAQASNHIFYIIKHALNTQNIRNGNGLTSFLLRVKRELFPVPAFGGGR